MTHAVAFQRTSATSGWTRPPKSLALPADEVQVWRAELDLPDDRVLALERRLAADEIARAARFRFERDRRRYVAARGILRSILGRYLDVETAAVPLGYGVHGKPFLSDPAHAAIRFNIAHSDDLALCVVARGREVGIDVERMRPDVAVAEIAADVLTPAERHAVLDAPSEDSARAVFYRLWTCKEAYLKATGTGFAVGPGSVELALNPAGAAFVTVAGNADEARRWWLHELHAAPEFVAALAVEDGACQVHTWSWSETER